MAPPPPPPPPLGGGKASKRFPPPAPTGGGKNGEGVVGKVSSLGPSKSTRLTVGLGAGTGVIFARSFSSEGALGRRPPVGARALVSESESSLSSESETSFLYGLGEG